MGLIMSRLLTFTLFFGVLLSFSPARGQEQMPVEPILEEPAAPARPDSPSLHLHVTDVSSAWAAMRETRLRQTVEALFELPFVAEDDNFATLNASLALIAERGGIEPTFDSLLGDNTRELKLVIFDEDDLDDPTATPYILEAHMSSPQLATAVSDVLSANIAGNVMVSSAASMVMVTNAPERLIQDRMADWRAPLVAEALELTPIEGAQLQFFAQPARDKEPGGGDKISAGHVRFMAERIDLSLHSLPASEGGSLRVPAAEGLRSLDSLVSLAETPHVVSMAYQGAAAMLEKAAGDDASSRGRLISSGLETVTGVPASDLLVAFGEGANLSINSMTVRSMFDFNIGLTGAWEVRDHAKAAEIIDSLRETHTANLTRDAQSYSRPTDGLAFVEEQHRGLTVLSAPLMIFPIQPSTPPTLNLALADEMLLMGTSRSSLIALIDRYLDGDADNPLVDRARLGHDLPHEVHSLGTADFVALAEVFRRALPVIVALTQGGREAQVFGRAIADVIGSLGHGAATGIYEPHGQAVHASLLLAPPNPAP